MPIRCPRDLSPSALVDVGCGTGTFAQSTEPAPITSVRRLGSVQRGTLHSVPYDDHDHNAESDGGTRGEAPPRRLRQAHGQQIACPRTVHGSLWLQGVRDMEAASLGGVAQRHVGAREHLGFDG